MTQQGSPTFTYEVRIDAGAALLCKEPFSKFPRAKEALISSDEFASYEECERALARLLGTLSTSENEASGLKHVIINQLNPDIDGTKKDSSADWDSSVILRSYIADASKLKAARLQFRVSGLIRADQNFVLQDN